MTMTKAKPKPKEETKKVTRPKKKPAKKKKGKTHTLAEQIVDAGLVLDACGDDEEVAQFFLVWLQNGRDASKAYKALHPKVTHGSSKTLGARMLARVDRRAVAEAYGIGYDEYFKQLKEGMTATKKISINFKTFTVEDHKTRRAYHEAAGKILGIEQDQKGGTTAVQVNINKAIDDWVATD